MSLPTGIKVDLADHHPAGVEVELELDKLADPVRDGDDDRPGVLHQCVPHVRIRHWFLHEVLPSNTKIIQIKLVYFKVYQFKFWLNCHWHHNTTKRTQMYAMKTLPEKYFGALENSNIFGEHIIAVDADFCEVSNFVELKFDLDWRSGVGIIFPAHPFVPENKQTRRNATLSLRRCSTDNYWNKWKFELISCGQINRIRLK